MNFVFPIQFNLPKTRMEFSLSIESSCRVCMIESVSLIGIFDEHEGRAISDLVREISGVLIEPEDGLSKKICRDCFDKTLDFQAFRQLCIDSDETVRYNLLLDDACDSQSGSQDIITEDQEFFLEDEGVQQETAIEQEYTQQEQLEYNDLFVSESNEGDVSENVEPGTIKIERLQARITPSTTVLIAVDDEEITKKMREAHLAKEQQKKYSCEFCDKKFKFPSKGLQILQLVSSPSSNFHLILVTRHKEAVHKNLEQPKKNIKKNHFCEICGKAFVSQFKVRRHFVVHDTELRTGLQKSWTRNFLTCELCEKTFHNQKTLDRHKLICEMLKSSLIDRPEDYEYICSVCARIFATHDEMMGCLKAHTVQKESTCVMCPGIVINDIVKHGRNHDENAVYKCCVCHKLYPPGDEIIIHLLRHKEYRPFTCSECGKSFYEKYKLRQHLKTHDPNAPKPFSCTFCKKSFAALDYLNCHVRRKHSEAKPFPCTVCDKSFAFLHDLKLHSTNHTGKF